MSDENKGNPNVNPKPTDFGLGRGRGDGTVLNLHSGFKKPVHVAVLCPPGAAVTVLLNIMGEHNGIFVMMQQIPMQMSSLAKANGQANIQLFPLMVFAIGQADFESWMNTKYDVMGMYQMQDIINGKVTGEVP